MMTFDLAFEKLHGNEGGFTNNPKDKGNWTGGEVGKGVLKGTKFGISALAYPTLDIEHLALAEAKAICKRDYWGPAGCDVWPDAIKFQFFDLAINTSQPGKPPVQVIKLLQRAVGADDDGVVGPQTLMKVNSMPPERVLKRFRAHAIKFYTSLKTWNVFGAGWVNRLANNMLDEA